MNWLLISGTCLTFFGSVNAQSPNWHWAKSMGGDNNNYCYSVATEPVENGDVYATGWFSGTVDFDPGPGIFNLTSSGEADIFITKLDGSGNFVWAKSIGGSLYAQGWSMVVDPGGSGDIYITGSFQGTVDFDPNDGTYNLTSAGDDDIYVVKLDGNGNLVWARAMGGEGNDIGRSIAVDPSGSGEVYLTGSFSETADFDPGQGIYNLTSNGDVDIFITKLNDAGNLVWAKSTGGVGFDHGYSIALDPNGNIFTTGTFCGTVNFAPGGLNYFMTSSGYRDIFISKYDNSGNLIWAKSMGGNGSDADGQSISIDASGRGAIYTVGYFDGTIDFDPGPGTYTMSGGGVFISKLNGAGDFVWAKELNGIIFAGTDHAVAIDPSGSGDVYMTGMFYGGVDFDPGPQTFNLNSAGYYDIFVSKLDNSGNFKWATNVGGVGSEAGTALAIDHSGNIYVGGYFESPSINFGSTTLINPESFYLGQDGNKYFYYSDDIFISKLNPAPLSVNLISFNAIYNKVTKGVDLEWTTTNEINNDYFSIERSNDLKNFEEIARIKGAGTNTNVIHYKSIDPNPEPGKNYYRLRQTDFDGTIAYSPIVTININSVSENISVYPNPTVDQLTIEFGINKPSSLEITLFSESGKIMYTSSDENISRQKTIDMRGMLPGIYLLESIVDGTQSIHKVVKD